MADNVAQNLEMKSTLLSAFQNSTMGFTISTNNDNVLITIPRESGYAWYKIESL